MSANETALSKVIDVASAPSPQPPPQYIQGFDGIATTPFPEEARKILGASVNPEEVEIKPDGIVYLSHVSYRRILTRAFGAGGWALAPRSPSRERDGLLIYHGALFCLGRFVSEAVGECQYRAGNDNMTYASALEGARSDCLTRCCKDLGIAMELWDKSWREAWQKRYAVCEWKEAKSGKWAGQKRPHWKKKGDGAEMPEGRNVGGKSEAVPAPKAETAEVGAVHSAPVLDAGGAHPDTGEAPDEDELTAISKATEKLNWAKPHAASWLKKHFGAATRKQLTKRQALDALQCLVARQTGEDVYRDVLAKLVEMGRAK